MIIEKKNKTSIWIKTIIREREKRNITSKKPQLTICRIVSDLVCNGVNEYETENLKKIKVNFLWKGNLRNTTKMESEQ